MPVYIANDSQVAALGEYAFGRTSSSSHHLGIAVANLVGALNIQRIVIAGSLARFGEALLEPIRTEMRRRSMDILADETCVEASNLGRDIVIQGAAALLLTHELGIV